MNEKIYQDGTSPIVIYVTRIIEADYVKRGVFPSLRTERAMELKGNYLHFGVQPSLALDVLADAKERYKSDEVRKGLRHAYFALVKNLRRMIEGRDEPSATAPEFHVQNFARIVSQPHIPPGTRVCTATFAGAAEELALLAAVGNDLPEYGRVMLAAAGLLSTAIRDLTPRVGNSNKLARALEDITAARESLLRPFQMA